MTQHEPCMVSVAGKGVLNHSPFNVITDPAHGFYLQFQNPESCENQSCLSCVKFLMFVVNSFGRGCGLSIYVPPQNAVLRFTPDVTVLGGDRVVSRAP